MSNRIPLCHVGHKLNPLGGSLFECPSCKKPSLYVDTRDENNVCFDCANGCSHPNPRQFTLTLKLGF